MASKEEFKHESLEDCESLVKYLKALSESFKKGQLYFGSKNKHIVLEPNNLLNLEVKAKKKNERVKLTLKFRWKENDSENVNSNPLIIETNES